VGLTSWGEKTFSLAKLNGGSYSCPIKLGAGKMTCFGTALAGNREVQRSQKRREKKRGD